MKKITISEEDWKDLFGDEPEDIEYEEDVRHPTAARPNTLKAVKGFERAFTQPHPKRGRPSGSYKHPGLNCKQYRKLNVLGRVLWNERKKLHREIIARMEEISFIEGKLEEIRRLRE